MICVSIVLRIMAVMQLYILIPGHFRTRNGLSLRRREPGALMYSLLVDEAELLFRRYLCMCEHSVALFAVACVLVVRCIPKPVQ